MNWQRGEVEKWRGKLASEIDHRQTFYFIFLYLNYIFFPNDLTILEQLCSRYNYFVMFNLQRCVWRTDRFNWELGLDRGESWGVILGVKAGVKVTVWEVHYITEGPHKYRHIVKCSKCWRHLGQHRVFYQERTVLIWCFNICNKLKKNNNKQKQTEAQ